MRLWLPWLLCAGLLLALGLLLYLVLAFYVGRPADAKAAEEMRDALGIYGEVVLYKGLWPALLLTLPLYRWLDHALGLRDAGWLGATAGLFACAALAALVVAPTLLRVEAFGLPGVVFTGPGNFVLTVLQMAGALTAATMAPRLFLPGLRRPDPVS